MEYEWDEEKRQANLDKHDVDILDAAFIFENWVLTEPDARFDYGEVRFKSVGMVDDDCYVVIHAERNGRTRLISAWLGGRRDRGKYQAGYARRTSRDER
jgi:uncharacterized DUF497 family protein